MKTWRVLHTYAGVGTGSFIVMMAMTGVLMTFEGAFREPSPTVPRELARVAAVPLSEIMEKSESLIGAPVARVYLPGDAQTPIRIRLRDELRTDLYFAANGEVVARRDKTTLNIPRILFDLHTGAIAGRLGELFVAAVGITLTLLVVTGLSMWPFLLRWRRRRDMSGYSDPRWLNWKKA